MSLFTYALQQFSFFSKAPSICTASSLAFVNDLVIETELGRLYQMIV